MNVYLAFEDIRLSEDKIKDYLTGMPASIRTAIQRYRRWEDRQATLVGKLLLLRALRSGFPDWKPLSALAQLEYTGTGKPFIRGGAGFNISHSGGVVVLALVDGGTVGVDVEKIRPIQMEDFSHYLPEVSEMDGLDISDRLNMFYTCWTRKEAVLKSEGSGLQATLAQVQLQRDTAIFKEQVWHLKRIDCGAGYICHVATSKHQAECRTEVVKF